MTAKQNAEGSEPDRPKQAPECGDGRVLVNRHGVALALGVSLRTLDRMLAAKEIVPIWVHGLRRFDVPEVMRHLAATALTRKHGPGRETPAKGKVGSPEGEIRMRATDETPMKDGI